MSEGGFAHPGAVFPGLDAGAQALLVAGAVTAHHTPELAPVDGAEVVVLAGFVPLQVGVGKRHAQDLGLLDGRVDKLLAQLVVADALDAPTHRLRTVGRLVIGRAEHHQAGPPPAVDRVLHHGALGLGAVLHHGQQGVVALALVKALFAADADHGAGVGRERAAADRHLVHDGRAIDQPADGAHVGPVQRGVVEDRAVLGLARVQGIQQFVTRHAQGLGRRIQVQAMAALVLDLGQQDGLALERGRAGDPVALGQHANDLGVGVLADLAHQGLAVVLGHPVLGLDEVAIIDAGLKALFKQRLLGRADRFAALAGLAGHGVHCLGVHGGVPLSESGLSAAGYRSHGGPCRSACVRWFRVPAPGRGSRCRPGS